MIASKGAVLLSYQTLFDYQSWFVTPLANQLTRYSTHPFISPACSAFTLLARSFCLRLSALLMAEKRRMLRMTRETQGTRWTQITRNLDSGQSDRDRCLCIIYQ